MQKVEYGFYRLEVWKLGMQLVDMIYEITKKFPSEEKFSLVSQIRRSAVSGPLNIAEGSIKRTKKDFASFIRIALGSLMETMTCLEISLSQKYITMQDYEKSQKLIQELYFKLIALDKFLTNKTSNA
ncbi:MAG: four helix bundle protein [Candidatus Moranbacteria bacterium]|nr:four helix bundle protein [Candidatus Moranbacteria bacterium]